MKKLPMIYQDDSIECGLAALAMILHYHGCYIKLSELRNKCFLSLSGISIGTIVRLAESLKFKCIVLRIELENIRQILLPAILHWDRDHFVVLKQIKKNLVVIHDSSRGKLVINFKDFSKKFSGVVLECKPTAEFRPQQFKSQHSILNWLKGLPIKSGLLVKTFLFTLTYQVILLKLPHYFSVGMEQYLKSNKTNVLLLITLGFMGLRFYASIAKLLKTICINTFDRSLSLYLGESICTQVMHFSLSYYEKHFISDILNRFNSIEQLRQIISSGFIEGILGGILSLTTFIIMFTLSPFLVGVTFSFASSYLIFKLVTLRYYKKYLFDMIMTKSKEQMCFLENIRGIQPIKIFSKENNRLNRWKKYYGSFLQSAYKNNLIKSSSECTKELIFGLEIIVITYFVAAKQISTFSIGIFYSYLFYRQQFCESLITFMEKIFDIKMLALYCERLEALVNSEKKSSAKKIFRIPDNYHVKVNNIFFRYLDVERFLFSNLSFSVNPGEVVAITGPSGSGKTTLLKILMGLISPEKGEVLVGGCPLAHLSPGIFSAVMQEDNLLSGSIADNISFFSKVKNMEKIIQCAKLAGVLEEIFRMPFKFNTLVGDMGTTLSGGQKQRILLARALYADPKILFLDEATSHLDVQKEHEVTQKIKSLRITIIMIAHRPQAIAIADRLIKLE